MLLYLAHMVALAGAAVAMGVLVWRAGVSCAARAGSPRGARSSCAGYARRALGLVAATGPGVALALVWIAAHREHVAMRIPFLELAAKLGVGYALVSIDRRELFLSSRAHARDVRRVRAPPPRAAGPRTAAAPRRTAGSSRRRPSWCSTSPCRTWSPPGAHVSDRFAWFALVSFAAWIGAGTRPGGSLRRIAVAFAVVAVAALGVRFQKQRELSDLVEEFVSAKAVIERGARAPAPRAARRTGHATTRACASATG